MFSYTFHSSLVPARLKEKTVNRPKSIASRKIEMSNKDATRLEAIASRLEAITTSNKKIQEVTN